MGEDSGEERRERGERGETKRKRKEEEGKENVMALLARLSAGWRSYLVHSHALRVARCQNLALLRESRKNFSAEVSEDEECQLHITDACVERIRRLKENAEDGNKLLRIRVDSGGCSGFQYSFTLDDVSEEGDRTVRPFPSLCRCRVVFPFFLLFVSLNT